MSFKGIGTGLHAATFGEYHFLLKIEFDVEGGCLWEIALGRLRRHTTLPLKIGIISCCTKILIKRNVKINCKSEAM